MRNVEEQFLVLSRVVEKDMLKGFLVVSSVTGTTRMLSLLQIQTSGHRVSYLNAEYSDRSKTLVGTHGSVLANYPAITKDYICTARRQGLVVMCVVVDETTKKPLGVVAFNSIGARFDISTNRFNDISTRAVMCNFNIKVGKDGYYVENLDGSAFPIIEMKPRVIQKPSVASANNNLAVNMHPNTLPEIKISNFADSLNSRDVQNSAQDKLLLAITTMNQLTPYYYTIFMAISRKAAPGLGTLGVTEDTLYYDVAFIAQMQIPELVFVLIHEVLHIAMQHALRFGNRKYHELWNIACDLYINTIICRDFGLTVGGDAVSLPGSRQNKQVSIKTPTFGVFAETIGEKIDLAIDTPESIYSKLLKENVENKNGDPMKGNLNLAGMQRQQAKQQNGGGADENTIQELPKQMKEGIALIGGGLRTLQSQLGNSLNSNLKDFDDGTNIVDNGEQAKDLSIVSTGLEKIIDAGRGGQDFTKTALNAIYKDIRDTAENAAVAMAKSSKKSVSNALDLMEESLGDLKHKGDDAAAAIASLHKIKDKADKKNLDTTAFNESLSDLDDVSDCVVATTKIEMGIQMILTSVTIQEVQGQGQGQGQQQNQQGQGQEQQQNQQGQGQGQGQEQQNQQGQGQGQGQGQQQSQQGQGQGQGQGQQSQQGQGKGQGQGGSQQGMEQKTEDGQGSGSGQKNQQNQQGQQGNNDDPFGGSENDLNKQQNSDGENNFDESENKPYTGMKEVNVTYNGKKLTGTIMQDVMTADASRKDDAMKIKRETSKNVLERMNTAIEKEKRENGVDLVKNAGAGGGLTQRYIEVGLSAGVDWRVFLKNMCRDKPKKVFTLSQPNVQYMNRGITVADRHAIGKPTRVSNVKFAIDVSGSVSQKELQVMLSEINNIFNYYKVDGELIYWSTEIGDVGKFSSLKDMLKVQPNSTGGTDVKCVFEYLTGQKSFKGKYEEDKLRDIKGIFIITDGYFDLNFDEYTYAMKKKVYWLITGAKGNPITFNPPFGRIIPLELDM